MERAVAAAESSGGPSHTQKVSRHTRRDPHLCRIALPAHEGIRPLHPNEPRTLASDRTPTTGPRLALQLRLLVCGVMSLILFGQ